MTPEEKYRLLLKGLVRLKSVLVAFSGGVDSTLLLKAAQEALPDQIIAATARSALNPPGELEWARQIAENLDVHHVVLDFSPLEIPEVRTNAQDRCFHCKKNLAQLLWATARQWGAMAVVEGSQKDDDQGFRPGASALTQAGILSPLKEAGLTKPDVRHLLRRFGLENAERPAGGCLATRFPYGTTLTRENLNQTAQAERLLDQEGFSGFRARHHGELIRIELNPDQFERLMDREKREKMVATLKKMGFRHVTLDLAGYRSGVFDPQP